MAVYGAQNEDVLAIEWLATRSLPTRNISKRSIVGGDLNLFHAEWKGDAEKTSGFDARVKKFTVAY